MRERAGRQAMTLIEVVIATSLFVVLSAALFLAVRASTRALTSVQDSADAQTRLRNAEYWLLRDLRSTSVDEISYEPVSDNDGYALWFLSARDPATGDLEVSKSDGSPNWQRNILYYLVRSTTDTSSTSGTVPGDDPYSPYKVLIRKVIRNVGYATAGTSSDPEQLLTASQVSTYLTQPDGSSVAAMSGEAGVDPGGIRIITTRLLSFEVDAPGNPDADVCPPFLCIDLRAVRLREARKSVAVGQVNLLDSPFTVHFQGLVQPGN